MANEPQQVDLLRNDLSVIFSVTESHPESLNGRGSENTRIARIIGPVPSVVTFYDDQQFNSGQNAVTITKTVAEPIVVPIAQNFVDGVQHNGIFFGTRTGYTFMLSKHVEEHTDWLNVIKKGIEVVIDILGNSDNQKNTDQTTGSDPVGGGKADGFISKSSGGSSDNNHVDNLSSIQFGGEPVMDTSSVVARLSSRL
jgi:hypothetical protein